MCLETCSKKNTYFFSFLQFLNMLQYILVFSRASTTREKRQCSRFYIASPKSRLSLLVVLAMQCLHEHASSHNKYYITYSYCILSFVNLFQYSFVFNIHVYLSRKPRIMDFFKTS